MSDKSDDLAWWNGEPINAMTRERLQGALIEANLIIDELKSQIICWTVGAQRFANLQKDHSHDLRKYSDSN